MDTAVSPELPDVPVQRFRVGIAVPATGLAAWHAKCVDAVQANPTMDLAAVIVHPVIERDGGSLAWRAFRSRYLDRRSRSLRVVEREVPMHVMSDGNVPAELDLDAVLVLEPRSAPDSLLVDPPWEVWRFEWGGAPPGFDEILGGASSAAVVLRTGADGRDGTMVAEGHVRTRPHSVARTADDARFIAADLLARSAPPATSAAATPVRVAPEPPTTTQLARLLARQAANFVSSQAQAVVRTPLWNVGVVDAPIERFLDPAFTPTVRWLPTIGPDRYRADPFGCDDVVLVETYDHRTRVGVITPIDREGREPASYDLPVRGHASYPYLVRDGGETWCTPQLDTASGVDLYRFVTFPTEWVFERTIIPGVEARDPTLVRHDGRWWAFFTDAAAGPMSHLHVWWADELQGPWRPHRRNPVKVDVRSARPGGTPFSHEDRLYRPAQDCSTSYGAAISLCRVDVLTPDDFEETVVRRIAPFPGRFGHGVHTLAAWGDATLVDGLRFGFTPAGARAALSSRLARRP